MTFPRTSGANFYLLQKAHQWQPKKQFHPGLAYWLVSLAWFQRGAEITVLLGVWTNQRQPQHKKAFPTWVKIHGSSFPRVPSMTCGQLSQLKSLLPAHCGLHSFEDGFCESCPFQEFPETCYAYLFAGSGGLFTPRVLKTSLSTQGRNDSIWRKQWFITVSLKASGSCF